LKIVFGYVNLEIGGVDMNENNSNENVNNEVENKVEYVPKSKKSRKGDDGIYVQYRKPSFFSTILLVLIGILIGIVIMLLVYVVKTHKDLDLYKEDVPVVEQPQEENANPMEEEKQIPKIEINLNPDSDFITLLYSKLPMREPIDLVYKSEFVDYNGVSDNYKLLYVLRNIESEVINVNTVSSKLDNKFDIRNFENYLWSIAKIDLYDVNIKYKSLYGADKEVPLIDVETGMAYVYEYVAEDNCFYGHSYPGGGGYGGYTSLKKITNCEVSDDGNEVYIYDSYIVLYGGPSAWKIYNNVEFENPIATDIVEVVDENGSSLFNGKTKEELLNQYLNSSSGKFKHTFKLDSAGNYYWYSSEPIQ